MVLAAMEKWFIYKKLIAVYFLQNSPSIVELFLLLLNLPVNLLPNTMIDALSSELTPNLNGLGSLKNLNSDLH